MSDKTNRETVLILTSFYEPAYLGGGPIQTLKALVKAAPENFDIKIICENHDLGTVVPLVKNPNEWRSTNNAKILYLSKGIKNAYHAFKSSKDADILYLNSFFNPKFTILPIFLGILLGWNTGKILLAPRGELDPGALKLKTKKKKTYIRLFKFLKLQNKVIWHSSNELEASNVRRVFGNDVEIVIRENETSLDLTAKDRKNRPDGDFRLVFASRIHEKKGLHILLKALLEIQKPVQLSIIGASEDAEYEKECHEIVRSLPANINVTFYGGLKRSEVLEYFSMADLFAFPTAGENFGHVIAEALSQSCPVMCSTFTPWTSLLECGAGIVVNSLNIADWSEHLKEFLNGEPEIWQEKSAISGEFYNQWRSESKGDHVFSLISSAK